MTFTRRQGEYLAFMHQYRLVNGRAPAESEIAGFFGVSAPSAHQMVVSLDKKGLIRRAPGVARSIRVLVDPLLLPPLGGQAPDPAAQDSPREAASLEDAVVIVGSRILEGLFAENEIHALDDRELAPLLGRVLDGIEVGLTELGVDPLAAERAREQVFVHAQNLYVRLCKVHDPKNADEEEDAYTFRHLMLHGTFPPRCS